MSGTNQTKFWKGLKSMTSSQVLRKFSTASTPRKSTKEIDLAGEVR